MKRNCIICKIDYFQCIIFVSGEVIVIDNDASPFNKKKMFNYLTNGIDKKVFHLKALEYIFIEVCDNLLDECNILFNNKSLSPNQYTKLLNLEYRVNELHTLTEDFLKRQKYIDKMRYNKCDNNLVQTMFESYDLRLEDIMNEIKKLIRRNDYKQRMINLQLTNQRNKFAKFELIVSCISLCIAIGSFIASVFGMNLMNHYENSENGFANMVSITAGVMVLSLLVLCYAFVYKSIIF